jgi:hypothetical protein
MAAAEVDVLQLADRPWAEISAIRLTGTPAPLPPPPLPEDDSVQCDFRTLLFVHDGPVPPFADCDIRGRPAHRVFTQGVRRPGALPAAYGRRGAASRAGAREKVLDALDTKLFTDTSVRYGAAKVKAHRCILHAQSPFCRAALQFAPQNGVDLPFCGAALETHLRRLVAYLYTQDKRELEELLDACYVDDDDDGEEPAAVTVARVADALLLDDLRKAALDRLVRCVDLASAASLLGVARDLTDDRLRRACLEEIVRRGPDACRRAAGADVFDASLPPATHAGLRRLAALAASNPVCCGAALPDAREALAMLREALDDQAERLADADERQRLEADAPSAAYVLANIERQRAHVAFLRDFIVKQESEFVAGDRWTLGV